MTNTVLYHYNCPESQTKQFLEVQTQSPQQLNQSNLMDKWKQNCDLVFEILVPFEQIATVYLYLYTNTEYLETSIFS